PLFPRWTLLLGSVTTPAAEVTTSEEWLQRSPQKKRCCPEVATAAKLTHSTFRGTSQGRVPPQPVHHGCWKGVPACSSYPAPSAFWSWTPTATERTACCCF